MTYAKQWIGRTLIPAMWGNLEYRTNHARIWYLILDILSRYIQDTGIIRGRYGLGRERATGKKKKLIDRPRRIAFSFIILSHL